MHDLAHFAIVVLLVALTVLAAVALQRLAALVRIPAPALLLVAAAGASAMFPRLRGAGIITDQRIVTVALAVILFEGGLRLGRRGVRRDAAAIAWLGVAGTLVTTAALATGVHLLFGQDWRTALLIGAALAPTDPAAVFSVLCGREIEGRTGTLLEGESGANDPVGIAVLVSLLGATGSGWHAVGSGLGHFALQLGVGVVVGIGGGWLAAQAMSRLTLPNAALYPVVALTAAFVLYGAAGALDGSGYLAVFLAGMVVGERRSRHEREVVRFAENVAGIAEMVAFVVLGLSVDVAAVLRHHLWLGLGIAALTIVVVRPVFVGAVLAPIRMTRGERGFVLFSGLKGAVRCCWAPMSWPTARAMLPGSMT